MDSLLALNDDIVHLVGGQLDDSRQTLIDVSSTCRHLRAVLLPFVYRRFTHRDDDFTLDDIGEHFCAKKSYEDTTTSKNIDRFLCV